MLRKTGKHVVALAIMMIAAGTLVVTSAADVTVGQFIQRLAQAKNLTATDPQIAADSLKSAGLKLPAGLDLSAPLTEGDVTTIARAAGIKVSASDPDATFSTEQADQFFDVFAGDLGGSSGSGIGTRAIGTCNTNPDGTCAQPGATCESSGKIGFCQPGISSCNCNTGLAKGKRKQVVTPGEPE